MDEEKKSFQSSTCDKSSVSAFLDVTKPFECDICDGYQNEYFNCKVCGKNFKTEKDHNVHSTSTQEQSNDLKTQPDTTHAGKRSLRCNICH